MRKSRGGGPGTKTSGSGKTAVRSTMTPVFGRGAKRGMSGKGRSGGRAR